MIPSPNLDDRTFEDIVDEAIRLIPQYCPDWTNFNRSDPGITLIELFAWMVEMIIYRLNKVPDKNYLAFLDLIGIKLKPPQPARTVLTFKISDKVDSVLVPKGTTVLTKPSPEGKQISFETENDLLLIKNQLKRCLSQYHDKFEEHTSDLFGGKKFPVFTGATSVDRYLYIGDKKFKDFKEGTYLTIDIIPPHEEKGKISKLLEWEYYDGNRWLEFPSFSRDSESDKIVLYGAKQFSPLIINEIENYWIRAKLTEVPLNQEETLIDTIKGKLEVVGEGVLPDIALLYLPEGDLYVSVDMHKNFYPFGKEPKVDTTLYLKCDEIFSHPQAMAKIEIALSEQTVAPTPSPSDNLSLRLEYFNGKRWKVLGHIYPSAPAESEKELTDTTKCFSKDGEISFEVPPDIQECEVFGIKGFFIRCRIESGDYGVPGAYELDGDRWVWKDEKPLRPPCVKSIGLKFKEFEHYFENVFAYNDFIFSDFSDLARSEYKPFQPFQPVAESNPTFYLGFEEPFPNEKIQIYFKMADEEEDKRIVETSESFRREQSVIWEYFSGKGWQSLYPKDETENFTKSGFLEFVGPKDHRKGKRFGDNLFWLRARLEMGGYHKILTVENILFNSVYASNLTTYGDTILGSSEGLPDQNYKFMRGPILPGQQILVKENEKPSEEEIKKIIKEEGEDAIIEDPEGGYWVRWHEVDLLLESGRDDRHYMKDIVTNEIKFGDGVNGKIPPKGERNIKCAMYQVGGGEEGNVSSGALCILKQTITFVDGVTNIFPAEGGSDLESIDEVKKRGPFVLKSRERAVTAEDFEWLAIQSSNSVARAKCIPSSQREGEVTLLIVPKVSEGSASFFEKPIPSTELLRRVKRFINERKLLTVIVNVTRPKFKEIFLKVEIILLSSQGSDRIKKEIKDRLKLFLHPLKGWKAGEGWPFGGGVYKVDLYQVVEEIEGIDFIDKIRIIDLDLKVEVEHLRLNDDELPHLVDIEIIEKAHERAM